jgi:hypothetical protein
MADRKLEDHPEDFLTLRNLLARALGDPEEEPPPGSLWARLAGWWRNGD